MDPGIDIRSLEGLDQWKSSLKRWVGIAWADLQLADVEVRREEEHLRSRTVHWIRQVERCRLEVSAAERELRDCRSSEGDCREEEDALQTARQSLGDAEQELRTAKYWTQRLQAAAGSYRFSANRMRKTLQSDIPRAVEVLEAMIAKFREGLAVEITSAPSSAASGSGIAQTVGHSGVQGLSDAANAEIESLIAQGRKQEALERCLAKVRTAFPDIDSWLDANPQFSIQYNPRDCKGKDVAITRFHPDSLAPVDMVVGDRGFSSASWLYSTLGHEFVHIRQALQPAAHQDFKSNKDRTRARWEFEAYAWEVRHARANGLSNHPQDLLSLKSEMSDWYNRMADSDRAVYLAEHEHCRAIVDRLLAGATP